MISFTTINCEGELRDWKFNSVEDLLRYFWTSGFDLPSNDDEIYDGNFVVYNKVIPVKVFEDIITKLSTIYWKAEEALRYGDIKFDVTSDEKDGCRRIRVVRLGTATFVIHQFNGEVVECYAV